jgi:hypothetical protein
VPGIGAHRITKLEPEHIERHCCIKAKGVLTVSQSGKQDPSGTFETVTNQASKSLPPGLYPSRWTSSGKPIA